MEIRSNGLRYTERGDVREMCVNYAGAYRTADRRGENTGGKAVTPYMVKLADNRARRVYAMAYGNGAVPYIIVRGEDIILDDATLDALALIHARTSAGPWRPVF